MHTKHYEFTRYSAQEAGVRMSLVIRFAEATFQIVRLRYRKSYHENIGFLRGLIGGRCWITSVLRTHIVFPCKRKSYAVNVKHSMQLLLLGCCSFSHQSDVISFYRSSVSNPGVRRRWSEGLGNRTFLPSALNSLRCATFLHIYRCSRVTDFMVYVHMSRQTQLIPYFNIGLRHNLQAYFLVLFRVLNCSKVAQFIVSIFSSKSVSVMVTVEKPAQKVKRY